jgi:fumarate reductase flavoprotein subunit
MAIALETGIATLGNMEAVQFHPTPIFPAGILLTEGCRGDGGLLLDVDGTASCRTTSPRRRNSPRATSCRAGWKSTSRRARARSRASASTSGSTSRLLGEHHIKHNLREVWDICHYFLGVDPVKDLIPVRPAQHYTMGGVRTNYTGESPTLKGLFAAGEAACWDMHGFNRLGGNSVAETVVAGMIVGEFIADFCDKTENDISTSRPACARLRERGAGQAAGPHHRPRHGRRERAQGAMQAIMTDKVGIFRTGQELEEAVDELQKLLVRAAASD